MDSMEINKGIAAVLIAGITFMVAGQLGAALVHPEHLKEPAIKVELAAAVAGPGAKLEPLPPIAPLLASADAGAGESNAKKQCGACHSFDVGGKNGVGPNLYEVMTRVRGASAGFAYSNGLKEKGGIWSYEDLNVWLKKPAAFVPGTRMAYAGLNSDKQRADIILYLHNLSKSPPPLPKP